MTGKNRYFHNVSQQVLSRVVAIFSFHGNESVHSKKGMGRVGGGDLLPFSSSI